MEVTKEDLLAECERLRGVIRILTEGAGRKGLLLELDVSVPNVLRIIVCAPDRDESALVRAAATGLVVQLRSVAEHEDALSAMACWLSAAAVEEPTVIGSLAEKPTP